MENEREYLQPVIGTLQSERFNRLSTLTAALFQLILFVLLELGVVLCLMLPNILNKKCDIFYVILYGQSAFWFISLVLDHYYKWRHHFIKLDGHFEFYDKITKYATSMFYIISFWNAVMIMSIGVFLQYFPKFEKSCLETGLISAVHIMYLIVTLEVLMLIPLIITYILLVYNFNKTHPIPDVEKSECWVLDDSITAAAVGYRCGGEAIADLLQKQADLIYYYKCTNNTLSSKIMELSARGRRNN